MQAAYKHKKKTVSKVDMMGVDHPSIVDRFQHPPIFPSSFFPPEKLTKGN
jgi:hypothetical protein